MNKFEKLIEYIINDEDSKARELFHNIVVEKSRDIYESIMDEEMAQESLGGNKVDDLVDEVGADESGVREEDEEGEEEFSVDGEDGEGDFGGDEFGGEEEFGGEPGEEEGSVEERVLDLEAELDTLKAEFDKLLAGEEHEEEQFPGIHGEEGIDGGADESGEEFGSDEQFGESKNPFAGSGKSGKSGSAMSGKSGKSGSAVSGKSGSAKSGKSGKPFESRSSSSELMREYVDRIGDIFGGQGDASEGDAVGAAGKKTSVNTKPGSVGPGADFGGNVVKTSTKQENQDGTSPTKASNEYNKGQGEIKSGNRNVPGGKADSLNKTGTEYSKEHGAEGQTTDGKVSVATKSVQKQNTGVKK